MATDKVNRIANIINTPRPSIPPRCNCDQCTAAVADPKVCPDCGYEGLMVSVYSEYSRPREGDDHGDFKCPVCEGGDGDLCGLIRKIRKIIESKQEDDE